MIEIGRRKLITGLISLVAAPAIVRVANIMPVHSMVEEESPLWQASWKPPGLFRCPYCGGMRGGMCPTCWHDALMPVMRDVFNSVTFTEAVDIRFTGTIKK